MSYSRSFQNYRPPRRYDGNPWTSALISESASAAGTFSLIDTITLAPVDADPANPRLRSFTTDNATLADAWYRIDWQDAALALAIGDPVHAGVPSEGAGRTAALISRLEALAGLDLEDDESLELLQEGSRELCARAEWLRASIEFGPSVGGQASYTVPPDVDRILRVSVGAVPYTPGDEWSTDWLNEGSLQRVGPAAGGFYYETTDDLGAQAIGLWPVPSDGLPISVKSVMTPPDLSDTQDPMTPARFDRYIEAYAAARAFETLEDNPEDASVYYNRFEAGVGELLKLRIGRFGREPFIARVVGQTI